MAVAAAADFRNVVMQSPEYLQAASKGSEIMFLHSFYRAAQKSGALQIAAGIAIWIHTLRAEKELSNLHIAKEMWKLLATSFDQVEEAAATLALLMDGRELDIHDYDRIPFGFQ